MDEVAHYETLSEDSPDESAEDTYDFWMLSGTDRERRHALRARLDEASLRPTWQRMKIGMWVFDPPSKHFTPEDLFREMQEQAVGERAISLATIYNTLNAFVDSGLLRMATIQSGKRFYDTNTTTHYHLHDIEGSMGLVDVKTSQMKVGDMPEIPDGYEVDSLIVTLRIKPSSSSKGGKPAASGPGEIPVRHHVMSHTGH